MIEIKKMSVEHVSSVAALEKLYFSVPWSEKSVAEELTNPLSLWLVAVDGGKLVGYIGSQSVMGESDMMNVAVAHEFRRSGVGELLVQNLIMELRKIGNHCITLEVRESNLPARNLYEKLGFSMVGIRPRYYEKPKENACIYRKEWEL